MLNEKIISLLNYLTGEVNDITIIDEDTIEVDGETYKITAYCSCSKC